MIHIAIPVGAATLTVAGDDLAACLTALRAIDLATARQAISEATAEPAPECEHGERIFRTGIRNAQRWSAYFCALPPAADDRCEPQWVER